MVGSQNADTAALVIKIIKRKNGTFSKHIVNMHIFNGEHFETQSIQLKKLVSHYNARQLVVDANGLGVGLVDFLIKSNEDPKSGEVFPPYSITNDEDGKYAKFKTHDSLPLLFNVKANASNSSDIHVTCLSQISSGKVKFLIDEMTAKAKMLSKDKQAKDDTLEFAKRLAPHVTTSILKEEMLNLTRKAEGKNIILDRINKKIGKDKFSALEYGIWWCKLQEDKLIKRRVDVDSADFLLIRQPNWSGKKNIQGWR